MPEENAPYVKITLETIYEVGIKTREAVSGLDSKVEEALKDIDDHEKRIRSMERRVWGFSGLAGIVSSVLTLFISNGGKI